VLGQIATSGSLPNACRAAILVMGMLNTPLLRAQSQPPGNIPDPKPTATDGAPVFEVATIKPSNFTEGVRLQLDPSSGLFRSMGTSLEALIVFAAAG
jgi:hypothetical protein